MKSKKRGRIWKIRKIGMVALFLLVCTVCCPRAEAKTLEELYNEQLEASGSEALLEELPQETQELLRNLGIDSLEMGSVTTLQPSGVWDTLLSLIGREASSPLRTGGIILGVILLCALLEGWRSTLEDPALSEVFGVLSTLAVCGAVLVPLSGCIRQVCDATESTAVFMTSYVPVYGAVLASSGQWTSALSYQAVVLWVAELVSLLATYVITPVMTVSLAMGVVGGVNRRLRLDTVSSFFNKTAVWLLGLITTVFVGLLSVQGIAGTAADTLAGKAMKFSLSSFVPVVGGALGDALSTVKGCLSLLKSTLGGFGILATALIILPPLIRCALWTLLLSLCHIAAELFGLETVGGVLKVAAGVVKTMIGILSSCGLFMIVATTIVTKAGTGG